MLRSSRKSTQKRTARPTKTTKTAKVTNVASRLTHVKVSSVSGGYSQTAVSFSRQTSSSRSASSSNNATMSKRSLSPLTGSGFTDTERIMPSHRGVPSREYASLTRLAPPSAVMAPASPVNLRRSLQPPQMNHVRPSMPQVQFAMPRFMATMPPSGAKLELPSLSPTMESGGLAKWYVKEGDLVRAGDLIADITTDKATVGFESQEDFYLAGIVLKASGDILPLGTTLGIIVDDEADIKQGKAYAEFLKSGGSDKPAAAAPAQEAAPAAASSKPAAATASAPSKTTTKLPEFPKSAARLELPSLSPTMESGGLAKWYAKEGDLIKPGDLIADITTDKATVGFESQDEYYLAAIIVKENSSNMPISTLLGITVENEEDIPAAKAYAKAYIQMLEAGETGDDAAASEQSSATPDVTASSTAAPQQAATSSSSQSGKFKHTRPLSPSVQSLVLTHNLDITSIEATGPRGHILKGDVLNALKNGTATKLAQSSASESTTKATSSPSSSPSPSQSTAAPGTSQRRRQRRTHVDIPVTDSTKDINAGITQNKTGTPHEYFQTAVSVSKLGSFINTYAKEADLTSVLTSAIVRAYGKHLSLDRQENITINTKITNTNSIITGRKATSIHAIVDALQQGEVGVSTAPATRLRINSYIGLDNVAFSNDPLPPGTFLVVNISSPYNVTKLDKSTGVGQLVVDREVKIGFSSDNANIDDTICANIAKDVQGFAANPISMLL